MHTEIMDRVDRVRLCYVGIERGLVAGKKESAKEDTRRGDQPIRGRVLKNKVA